MITHEYTCGCTSDEDGLRCMGTNAHFSKPDMEVFLYNDSFTHKPVMAKMGDFLASIDKAMEEGHCGDPNHEIDRVLGMNVHGCVPPAPVWYESVISIWYGWLGEHWPHLWYNASFDVVLFEEEPERGEGIKQTLTYRKEPECNPFNPVRHFDDIPF